MEKEKPQVGKQIAMPSLVCYVCGSQDFRHEHCKVICRKCGCLIENCSGD